MPELPDEQVVDTDTNADASNRKMASLWKVESFIYLFWSQLLLTLCICASVKGNYIALDV